MAAVYTKTSMTAISATQCQKRHRRVDLKSHDVYESPSGLKRYLSDLKSRLYAIKCGVNRVMRAAINEVTN